MRLFYIVFIIFFVFFSCTQDQSSQDPVPEELEIPELEELQKDEQALQDEIDLLRRRIRNADDSDDIDDLNEQQDILKAELAELEKQLRENRSQQQIVIEEVRENPFCQRTAAIRQIIMQKITEGGETAINSGLEDCRDVTDFMISKITGALVLRVRSLKAGDLNDLRGITSIDLSNNEMSSLPSGSFDDLVGLTGQNAIKLTGNDFSSLPSGMFDNLKKYNKGTTNYGLDILGEQLTEFTNFDKFKTSNDDNILPDLNKAITNETACDRNKGECRVQNDTSTAYVIRTDPACEKWEWDAVKYKHDELRGYLNAFNRLSKPYLYRHFEKEFKAIGSNSYNNYKNDYETFKEEVLNDDQRITDSAKFYKVSNPGESVVGKCRWPGTLSF